ncbi:hypothetical protein [Saccharothrix sp. ST-888]|uniref:hypothetical protein n=1 Tax=Saccharothrix sp. ST-888 TaxID=1427391 RepID=UPI0005ED0599|nr:hypothetical protein [Saccharothrix sp. ST-888]KJK55492.1 hypothetical protein UK12_28270 [Saccharothrix sp. ST-888]
MTLLLPYRVDITPGPATADDAPPRYHQLRLTVGEEGQGRAEQPVRCTRIAVRVPAPTSDPRLARQPLAFSTTVPSVRSSAQGQEWWIVPDTTDPAATVFACVPDQPARFDGTWTISFLIELDPGFETTDVEITEETAADNGPVSNRSSRVAATVLAAGAWEGQE